MALAPISPFGGVDAVAFYKSQPGLEVLRGQGLAETGATTGAEGAVGANGTGFGALLGEKLGAAAQLEQQGSAAAQALATGTASDISAATVAVQKAAISMQLVAAVRNKAVEAYQDVMRMQV